MTTGAMTAVRATLARRWVVDSLVIVAVTLFTGVLSGSQRWTGMDTPDSSFYATLSLHGDEVTDRAPITSYYWTRLGFIVPVRILTSVLGPFPGFAAYRMILILIIVAAAYLALRRRTTVPAAAVLTTLISLNTVLLGYLGNTYLTGSTLAGLFVLIACGVRPQWGERYWPSSVIAGATLGWLVMVNPYAAVLGGVVWVALAVRPPRPAVIARRLGVAALAGAAVFAAYLLAGRLVFPRMDWLGTYLEWNGKLNYADFASKDLVWLRDISMLVPVAALVVVLLVWLRNPGRRCAQDALVIVTTTVLFALLFLPVMGGITLEAPMYQAMLWPSALMGLALATTRVTDEHPWDAWIWLTALAGIALVIIAGHWPGAWAFTTGVIVAAVLSLAAGITLALTRRVIVALIALSLLLAGAQLLQNSRGPLGLYYLSPYSNAFNSNPISDKVHAAVNTEDWLLANSTRDDRILLWVDGDWVGGDRELYSVAGMQLWGENRVTLERTITADDASRLSDIRPTMLALYGPQMDGIERFWQSIPAELSPSPLTCYDFPWPVQFPTGHACLTRLTWPAS